MAASTTRRTLVTHLADFAADVRDGVPVEIQRDMCNRVLDVLGNSFAASDDDSARAVGAVTNAIGGIREATDLRSLVGAPAPMAALMNGTLAHALDFDDTHLRSVLHPSSSVVPAALAVGEARSVTGRALVAAMAAGLEIVVRLGDAAVDTLERDSLFFERGFHATSICGALGAAAASASVMGLPSAGIGHAIGISASMGAGLLEANRTGGSVKRVHCGWAAHAGVVAALLAEAGLTGPPTVLEGRFGFLRAHLGDRWDQSRILGGLGTNWETPNTAFKPYPTNHFTHAIIDAAIALRADGIDPDTIADIELGVPAPTLRTIAEPRDEKARPGSGYSAKFSGPFTVATALLGGSGLGVYLTDFSDDAVNDASRLRIAGLVRCTADDEATAAFPDQFGGVLRIRTASGDRWEKRIPSSLGGPGNRLSDDVLRQKFRLNAAFGGMSDHVSEVEAAVAALPELGNVRELFSAIGVRWRDETELSERK